MANDWINILTPLDIKFHNKTFLFFFLPDEESVTTRINYKDDFTINFSNNYNLLGINHLVNSDGNNGHILMSVLFDVQNEGSEPVPRWSPELDYDYPTFKHQDDTLFVKADLIH